MSFINCTIPVQHLSGRPVTNSEVIQSRPEHKQWLAQLGAETREDGLTRNYWQTALDVQHVCSNQRENRPNFWMENYKEAHGGLNDIFTVLRKMFVSCLFQLSLCSKYTSSCLPGTQPSTTTGCSHCSTAYSRQDNRQSHLLSYEVHS